MAHLFQLELGRLFAELRNYKLNNIVSLFDVFLICMGIFLGTGQEIFPQGTLFYGLLGMILWRYTVICLQTSCSIVQKEIRLGTLEQLLLARYGLLEQVLVRLLAKLLLETGKLLVVSAALAVIFRITPDASLNPILTLAAFLLCILGMIGIGCGVAAVALVYKKANALVNSVSYFTLFFTGLMVPLELLPAGFSYSAVILPFHWCISAIRRSLPGMELLWLTVTAAVWLLAGALCFRAAVHKVMADGAASRY